MSKRLGFGLLLIVMLLTNGLAPAAAFQGRPEAKPAAGITSGPCTLTAKNPYRSGSYVYGEATVSCTIYMNIDLLVELHGPNFRASSTTCRNTKWCSLRVTAPYAAGQWLTDADGSGSSLTTPPILWSDYKASSWVSL